MRIGGNISRLSAECTELQKNRLSGYALQNLLALTDLENVSGDEGGSTSGDTESGSGYYHYKDRKGDPKECTIFRYFRIDTGAQVGESEDIIPHYETHLGIEYFKSTHTGMKDLCPLEGSGCNPFTCQTISYVP